VVTIFPGLNIVVVEGETDDEDKEHGQEIVEVEWPFVGEEVALLDRTLVAIVMGVG
jgi:hypothetical protein